MKFFPLLFIGLLFYIAANQSTPPASPYYFSQQQLVNKPEPPHTTAWVDSDGGFRPAGVR